MVDKKRVITASDLRDFAAYFLDRTIAGEKFIVTRYGRVVAELIPSTDNGQIMEEGHPPKEMIAK